MSSSCRTYTLLCSVLILVAAAAAARGPQHKAGTADGKAAQAAASTAAAKPASGQYYDGKKVKVKHGKHGHHKGGHHGEDYYEPEEPRYYKPEPEYEPEPEYYEKKEDGPDPYLYPDPAYYEDYKKYGSYDAEPGTHRGDTHWKHKVTINGTEKCDFNDKDTFRVCLQEVSRDPTGTVAGTETGDLSFTSYFGCCPKTYSPYKKTFTDITPVGMCVWTVVPDATVKTAVHGGVKMGTVTAKCTVTAESKCLYPLKVDATFEISMDSPGPGIWKRISAAIPDDTDPDYTIYISSAARAQALSAREADPATKRESGMSAHVAAAATENDDDSSDRYGGDMRRHRERRDRDGHRYIDERRGSDEDGPADRRRGGGRGYRSYDKEEEASYEDRRGDGRGDRRGDGDDGGDDDNNYGDDHGEAEYGVTASAGRANVYTGPLSNFTGAGSDDIKCGKVEFIADFVDEKGTVRCPYQPDQRNVGNFNATTTEGRELVPVIECGAYDIMLVKKRMYKEHKGYGGYKYGGY